MSGPLCLSTLTDPDRNWQCLLPGGHEDDHGCIETATTTTTTTIRSRSWHA